ncbi:MAG: dTMP kinase [Janthinobacterium lividum]
MRAPGKFITFEGIDGAGKTTHLDAFRARLEARLQAENRQVVLTREPGGTPLGETLRDVLLHQPMHLETEALLMFAARREHLAAVIQPALERGDWVLCDRFTDASFAYQGGGRGLALDKLEALERWVQGSFTPDLTVLFDVPVETALARRQAARAPDRFERESAAFFERTRGEYLRRAAQSPRRFRVIDASRGIDAIRRDLEAIVTAA